MLCPPWPKNPSVYEIPCWPWLAELSRRHGRAVTLADLPAVELDRLASLGFDGIWLMGVWERSPTGARIAREVPELQLGYRHALRDVTPADVVGSPYCIHRYVVDARLGGPAGLALARQELARRGLRLLLDFVPNHLAVDHPWVAEHPERFVQGTPGAQRRDPSSWFSLPGGRILAHGRDPYFPAWTDVLQLDAFHPGVREEAARTLREIADQCDGVRCDMAMLLLDRVFGTTWSGFVGDHLEREYWIEAIESVRSYREDFLFIAEAYWDLEYELQQLGFDYCYDKRLYDRLRSGWVAGVAAHLAGDLQFQQRLVRFVENHDEERAARQWGPGPSRAAAVAALTLPGARLLHHGQLEGCQVRVPVQLGRATPEEPDLALAGFYTRLLRELADPVWHEGRWRLHPVRQDGDGGAGPAPLAWSWELGEARRLVVVNLTGARCTGRVELGWPELAAASPPPVDVLAGSAASPAAAVGSLPGLSCTLQPWQPLILRLPPA